MADHSPRMADRVDVTVEIPQEALDRAHDRAERLDIAPDDALWDVVDLRVEYPA